jgi:hypothetical protein
MIFGPIIQKDNSKYLMIIQSMNHLELFSSIKVLLIQELKLDNVLTEKIKK